MTKAYQARISRLHAWLLALWFLVSFGVVFFARNLQFQVAGWPFGFWMAAQGAVIVFIAIVALFAWFKNRAEPLVEGFDYAAFAKSTRRVHKRVASYIVMVVLFLLILASAEQMGLSRAWVAGIMLSATLVMYAILGVLGRTSDEAEYYVAGRRIPAIYNGMATAADWLSAASFISLAGGLYLQGFSGSPGQPGGLAYVLGWTGGFCLLALFVAPYLRRMNLYTIPDFFAVRYGGKWPRRVAAGAAVLCSFTYVVAQIYGVGLITSRITGVQFEIGILLGLGGVLVCSFLGGMRAVTWTQVAQYVIIILAMLIPVSWLSYKQLGNPFAPLFYGQQLEKISAMERTLRNSSAEKEVLELHKQKAQEYADKLHNVQGELLQERARLREQLHLLDENHTDDARATAIRRELMALPRDEASARESWSQMQAEYQARSQPLAGMPAHAQPFAGDPDGSEQDRKDFSESRNNFLALMFCLMVGTAGLPHLLTRFFTVPTVAHARTSVAWSLFFIALLYLCAPALAVLVKYEVMSHLVGQNFESLPAWVAQWAHDKELLSVSDVNSDHILQFAELRMGPDVVMLAAPEIGGLPYVVSALVAAGGLAAALSTADGLLLTIGNALSHDLILFNDQSGDAPANKEVAMRRVMWSKFAVLVAALVAAYVAAQKPAAILYLVSASFSLAAAAFVPAMVLGIFWKGTNRKGAVAGMLAGLGVTLYYMLINVPWIRNAIGLEGNGLWFSIQPVSAGVFGVPAGIVFTALISNVYCSKSSNSDAQ